MYDQRPNGVPSWGPPSWVDLILHELRAIRSEVMDTREDLGALKEGMRRSLANEHEIFGVVRQHGDRLTAVEARPQSLPPTPSGPPPTERVGLLASIAATFQAVAAVLKEFGQALGALMLLAAGLGLIATAPVSEPQPSHPAAEMSSPFSEP